MCSPSKSCTLHAALTNALLRFSKRYREVRDTQHGEPMTWFTSDELHAPVKELSSDKR